MPPLPPRSTPPPRRSAPETGLPSPLAAVADPGPIELFEDIESICVLECESIHQGIDALDLMVKEARTRILAGEPIPPGRFLIVLGGAVGEVESAFRRGLENAGALHDHLFLPEVASGVLPALRSGPRENAPEAIGLFETSSASACLDAADRGLKDAAVQLLQIHLTRGIGGKGFGIFAGRQDMVEAALAAAEERGRAHGRWIGSTLLARPDRAVVDRILAADWGRFAGQEIL